MTSDNLKYTGFEYVIGESREERFPSARNPRSGDVWRTKNGGPDGALIIVTCLRMSGDELSYVIGGERRNSVDVSLWPAILLSLESVPVARIKPAKKAG